MMDLGFCFAVLIASVVSDSLLTFTLFPFLSTIIKSSYNPATSLLPDIAFGLSDRADIRLKLLITVLV